MPVVDCIELCIIGCSLLFEAPILYLTCIIGCEAACESES